MVVASKMSDRDGELDMPKSAETAPHRAAADAPAWLVDRGGIRVAVATPTELPIVADILDEASAWMESRGLGLWPRPFPVDVLAAGLANGEAYLAWEGTAAVGTFALHRTERTFWGERPDDLPDHARYLHKLAVRRGHPGLGRALVGVAETITRGEGAAWLRLTCDASRPRLRRYYEELGFEHRGDMDVPRSRWRASLYEKQLG
jgi:GNAT superfamily N-acetyltransferase